MKQLSMTGDDWKSDRAMAAEARAIKKRDQAGRECAKALNAASKALGAYLQACRDCNDGSGDEERGLSDSRHRLITDNSEYAGFLENKHREGVAR